MLTREMHTLYGRCIASGSFYSSVATLERRLIEEADEEKRIDSIEVGSRRRTSQDNVGERLPVGGRTDETANNMPKTCRCRMSTAWTRYRKRLIFHRAIAAQTRNGSSWENSGVLARYVADIYTLHKSFLRARKEDGIQGPYVLAA